MNGSHSFINNTWLWSMCLLWVFSIRLWLRAGKSLPECSSFKRNSSVLMDLCSMSPHGFPRDPVSFSRVPHQEPHGCRTHVVQRVMRWKDASLECERKFFRSGEPRTESLPCVWRAACHVSRGLWSRRRWWRAAWLVPEHVAPCPRLASAWPSVSYWTPLCFNVLSTK